MTSKNMTTDDQKHASSSRFAAVLQRVVEVRPEEVKVLLLSGAYFFFVLAAYCVIRPIREEMAVVSGARNVAFQNDPFTRCFDLWVGHRYR